MFDDRWLNYYKFFNLINRVCPPSFKGYGMSLDFIEEQSEINKRWATVFKFVPYFGNYWANRKFEDLKLNMREINDEWIE